MSDQHEIPRCSGQSLYERARDPFAASWEQIGEHGRAIWRDAEQLISDRLLAEMGSTAWRK